MGYPSGMGMAKEHGFWVYRTGRPLKGIDISKFIDKDRKAAAWRRLGQLLEKNWAASKGLSASEADALADEAKHAPRKKRHTNQSFK